MRLNSTNLCLNVTYIYDVSIFFQFLVLKHTIKIRLEETEENKGSDYIEHGIPVCNINSENIGLLKRTYGSYSNETPLVKDTKS